MPFQVAVPDEVLDDLARRLAAARLAPQQTVADREPGDPAGEEEATIERIVQLLAYWRDGYDWRAQERRLNAVPQFRAKVDGVGLHFLYMPGTGPDPLPLLLCNGWPSSVVEYLGVLPGLTDPAAYGGDPRDSFTVVAPTMPGYGFSNVGHADALTPAEQSFVDASARWERDVCAYDHVQATRPRTLTFGLNDSPAGLAAWILEKWLSLSDPATVTDSSRTSCSPT